MHWINSGKWDTHNTTDAEFTFNDWENGNLVSRALNPITGTIRTIQGAIAAVSPTAPLAIGLNYARMAHCRAVVGYATHSRSRAIEPQPENRWFISTEPTRWELKPYPLYRRCYPS